MKVIEPTAKLYWSANILVHMEHCGRVCYNSYGKVSEGSAEKFLDGLIKAGHYSVLEHAAVSTSIFEKDPPDKLKEDAPEFGLLMSRASLGSVRCSDLVKYWSKYNTAGSLKELPRATDMLTFDITASRAFTHQVVRHRNLSFSQQSLRYCRLNKEDFQYVCPFKDDKKKAILESSIEQSLDAYKELLDDGANPDMARSVLPHCTATRIFVTGQATWWLEFLKLRFHKRASIETIKVAEQIYHLCPEIIRRKAVEELKLGDQFKEAQDACKG